MRPIRLFRLTQITAMPPCCPIKAKQGSQIPVLPKPAAHHRKEPAKSMGPSVDPAIEAQQHIQQQRHPQLPPHRIGALSKKIRQLQRLFDLLEEHFNLPAAAVEVDNR